MKIFYTFSLVVFVFAGFSFCNFAGENKSHSEWMSSADNSTHQKQLPAAAQSIYNYSFKTLEGKEIKLSDYKGKMILIVNTASECGYTPQYEQLEAVYEKYKEKLVIIGFPTNDFGGQEPGTNEEIGKFCKKNYGVTFPVSEKITVKGEKIHPLYKWLTSKELNGKLDSEIKWNFQKYLIDENGNFVSVFYSKIKPDAPEIIKQIEG